MKRKSKPFRGVLICAALLGLLLAGGCAARQNGAGSYPAPTAEARLPEGALLTVDGHGVPVEEFRLFLQDERALTAAHFGRIYGAEPDAGFWDRDFDGQTPNEYAREQALQKLLRAKLEAILLKERGLADDVSFEALMADMEKTNAEHAEKLKTGEVFYGLTAYDAATYYAYVRSSRWGELLRSQEEYCVPTGAELRAVYDEKPDYFTSQPIYTCRFIYEDGGEEEREVSAASVHKEDGAGAALLSALAELSPGDFLAGASLGGVTADVTLLSVTPGELLPFEDEAVQEQLAALCRESALYELISRRAAEAAVVIDEALYRRQVLG